MNYYLLLSLILFINQMVVVNAQSENNYNDNRIVGRYKRYMGMQQQQQQQMGGYGGGQQQQQQQMSMGGMMMQQQQQQQGK
jgi:hypothetical protein